MICSDMYEINILYILFISYKLRITIRYQAMYCNVTNLNASGWQNVERLASCCGIVLFKCCN